MTNEQRQKLREQLILHEGVRLKPYHCTAGKLSIGVGYNIDDRGLGPLETVIGRKVKLEDGITRAEALAVLDADIDHFEKRVRQRFPLYEQLDPVRQRVVLDMAFNLGTRALGFKKAIAALQAKDYTEAALHMMQSLWATQVGDGPGKRYDRAERLCDMMRTGKDPVG